MRLPETEVLIPTSLDEALAAFGDGAGVTVVGGGTLVMPEISAGRLKPKRALLVGRAGLAGVTRTKGTVTIGAATPVSALADVDEPLATAARYLGDIEVRGQATLGGNLCATSSPEAPLGDLQAPLIALRASARSAGAGGERTEALEDFLENPQGRLLLDVSYTPADKAGYAAAWRPHALHLTILAVAAAKRDGELRVAATGVAPRAVLLDPEEPLAGLELVDDSIASAWYRARLLPSLVEQALAGLEEAK